MLWKISSGTNPSVKPHMTNRYLKGILMNDDLEKIRCNSCGIDVPGYDGVHFSHKGATRFLCSKCYNEAVSEMTGLDFDHLSFHPITLTDKGNEVHTFHFQTHLFGDHVSIRAVEIRDGEPRGYEFTTRGDPEGDLFNLFTKLVTRNTKDFDLAKHDFVEIPYRLSN